MAVLVYCAACRRYRSMRHKICPVCSGSLVSVGAYRVNISVSGGRRVTRVVHGGLAEAMAVERALKRGLPMRRRKEDRLPSAVQSVSTAGTDREMPTLMEFFMGENSPVEIMAIDVGGLVCLANKGALARFGQGRQDLSGLPLAEIIPEAAHQLEGILASAPPDEAMGPICLLDTLMHVIPLHLPGGPGHALIFREHTIRAHDGKPVSAKGILENATVGIFQISTEGRFLFANPYMAKLFGYESPEDLFANLSDVGAQHYKSPRHRNVMLAKLDRGQGASDLEYTFLKRDGTPVHTRFSSRAVFGRFGRVSYYEGFITNISEQKETQRDLMLARQTQDVYKQELELLFNNISDGIAIIDRQERMVSVNPALRHICPLHMYFVPGFPMENLHKNCATGCFLGVRSPPGSGEKDFNHQIICAMGKGERLNLSLSTSSFAENQSANIKAVVVMRKLPEAPSLPDLSPLRQNSIIGKSRALRDIAAMVRRLSKAESTVLITGESGSGKELLAEMLHYNSPRSERILQKINCAALSETLLESDLFGHVKGSFTGATENKAGRLQLANRGTALLDEIGDVSPNTQLKLLRFLDTHEYQQVGNPRTYTVDVRIIACTNADLPKKIASGEFREDLYYRLKVITMHMPALREIKGDIPELAHHFINMFNTRLKKNVNRVSLQAMALLRGHDWPGNVRELKNVLEYACIMCQNEEITVEHLPEDLGR